MEFLRPAGRQPHSPRVAALARAAARLWNGRSLTQQFVLATSPILLAGMLVIGQWTMQRISAVVVDSHAAEVTLYTDSFVEPRLQELATSSSLSEEATRALDALLLPRATGQPVLGFRIWKGDTVVYSDRPDLTGRSFPPSADRARSWEGEVWAEYTLPDSDHGPVDASGGPILEIYVPVHETGTGRIIALAEIYQFAPGVAGDLARARLASWLTVGAVTLGMLLLQILVVGRGSRTIQRQDLALKERIAELSALLRENEVLRRRTDDANRRAAELNDAFLRRIGSDLHDGPVQLLGSAVLRIDGLREAIAAAPEELALEAADDLAILRDALRETLTELRNLSAGLAPPDVAGLSLEGALGMAVRRHERRTGTTVRCRMGALPEDVPLAHKSCLYRFVQEGLNNAVRHAGGRGQFLSAEATGRELVVAVEDAGPGLRQRDERSGPGGLGLMGLRDRIASLGGEFEAGERPCGGTRLVARFDLARLRPGPEAADA